MKFIHRSIFRIDGIRSLEVDPWSFVRAVRYETFEPAFAGWLNELGLVDLTLDVSVTASQVGFDELDKRSALVGRMMGALVGSEPTGIQAAIDERRQSRQMNDSPHWLIVEVRGDHDRPIAFSDVDAQTGCSVDVVETPTALVELQGDRAVELHQLFIGALQIAVGHRLVCSSVDRSGWYLRPDGAPHFRMSMVSSVHALAIKRVQTDAGAIIRRLLRLAEDEPGLQRAFVAYGQSFRPDLGATLSFLSAFSALEQLVKQRTSDMQTRDGLQRRFERLAKNDADDCSIFDRLCAQRNDLAHEARFSVTAADDVRLLFEKYL